jgi:putative heme transporter
VEQPAQPRTRRRRRYGLRALLLVVAGVSLYLLAPSLLTVLSSWPKLRQFDPAWIAPALACELLSYVSLWMLQRVALRTKSWFAVATSQLTGNAIGNVVPGGGATATAAQFGILVRSGIPSGQVASGLAASWAATTGLAFAIPGVAALAAAGGAPSPRGMREVAYLGAAAFVLTALVAVTAFAWDRPLQLVGSAVEAAGSRLGARERLAGLPQRLLAHRNEIRRAFRDRPVTAFLGATGKWAFDYLALVCILSALGARPRPSLVLLAYGAAQLLTMIPATPGGLGFVEAGLTGLLALAGVSAGTAAVATLAYRLVGFWLPLPVGFGAYFLARRRFGAPPQTGESGRTPSSGV